MHKYDSLIKKYLLIITVLILFITNFATVLTGMQTFYAVLHPVITGCGLAYIVNLFVKRYEPLIALLSRNRNADWAAKTLRPLAITLSYLTIGLVVGLVFVIVIPQLTSVLMRFIEVIPQMKQQVQQWIEEKPNFFPLIQDVLAETNFDYDQIFADLTTYANDIAQSVARGTVVYVTNLTSNIFDGFLAFVMSIYLLSSKEKLAHQANRLMHAYLPNYRRYQLLSALQIMNQSFESFFIGGAIEALILGTLVAVGMSLFGFPYALMVGVLTGVLSFIPYVGAIIAGIIGALLITAQDPMQGFLFLIFIVILQQIESNLIYPRVVGDSIGLPGLWVLIALTVFGGLFGLKGMILGIPMTASLYKMVRLDILYREGQTERHSIPFLESLAAENPSYRSPIHKSR